MFQYGMIIHFPRVVNSSKTNRSRFFGILARFAYKTILALGLIQIILILFTFLRSKTLIINLYKYRVIFFIILLNFLLFLYIPAELSYLQPGIIFLYFLLQNFLIKNFIFNNIF